MSAHQPVLFAEAIQGLNIKPDGIYVDGTFGRGGHSSGVLAKLGSSGRLIALDKDPEAIARAKQDPFRDPRFCILHDSFVSLQSIIQDRGFTGKVNGILLDLGVSSPQLDDAMRGFSFNKDGPLDMRMNPQQGVSAATWINQAQEADIANVLWEYGEERYSRRIARGIVYARKKKKFTSTLELAEVIKHSHPKWERRIHPATRSFQAIRIFINRELEELAQFLTQSLEILAVGGRLCVISFHSLEDRMVKRFIRRQASGDDHPPDLPIQHTEDNRRLRKIGGLVRANAEEININPRARSARLRIAEKIK